MTVNGSKRIRSYTKFRYGINTASTSDPDWQLVDTGTAKGINQTSETIQVGDALSVLRFTAP
jgi:hypothetical protein